MERRKFLCSAFISALSVSVFGKIKFNEGDFEGSCETTKDILGPFYRPNAPVRSDLTYKGLEGTIVELKGTVFGEDCLTPVKKACVEIWHCDVNGKYDNKSGDFLLRAKWFTDDYGQYKFKTILPGKYLNGSEYRPAHIHVRVTSEANRELISQIYFKGDPQISKDPWASKPSADLRTLPIVLEGTTGELAVNFDVFLSK